LAYAINTEIEEICPRIVQRVSLGPFFSKYTKNTDEVNKLFMGIDNPYLLAINIENAAVSVTQRMPSTRLMKRMLGQMVEKANYHNTEQLVFVAPFRLQQEILDPNYTEKEIKRDAIYGITEKGELNECYKR
jgi:broad specificity polyphosphatase/5'/3'-nucleotidase SurE